MKKLLLLVITVLSCKDKNNSLPIENSVVKSILTEKEKAEWGIRFPTFLYSFYKFIYNNQKLPSQDYFEL